MTIRTHDHEILIGSAVFQGVLVRDDSGRALYNTYDIIPEHQSILEFEQTNWINGHGNFWFMDDLLAFFGGQSIDTTQDGRIILGPFIHEVYEDDDSALDSAPVQFVWFATTGEWLCATAGNIYRYDVGDSGKWTVATTEVAGVTSLVEFNGYMFASMGSSEDYMYSADGDTWTTSTLDDTNAQTFFSAPNPAGTANVLWKSDGNELKYNASGLNGGDEWSTAAYIGDTTNDITKIFLVNDNLMVGRPDNLYHYDSAGGVHPLMDELKVSQSSNNFAYVANWQSSTYFSRVTSLGEITASNTFSPVGPLEETVDIGKAGTCVGLTSDKDYMYMAMDEGTNTHIYKSREVSTPYGLKWQHCPWVFLGTNSCATIGVCQHSASDRRLWFGYGTHTGYVIITDNPTADSAARFAASGWLRMSYIMGSNLYWDKLFSRLITETKGCDAGKTVTVKYRKDTDTSATNFAAAITTNGVVQTDATALVACKKIQFEVHLATDAAASTPEVLMFRATGVEKPEAVRIHDCIYYVGDRPSDRVETLRAALRTARVAVTYIRFADLRYGESVSGTAGTDFAYVTCQAGYPKEVEVVHEKGRQPELGLQILWQEVGNTLTDDWGYDYSLLEDIIQDVYDEENSALNFVDVG